MKKLVLIIALGISLNALAQEVINDTVQVTNFMERAFPEGVYINKESFNQKITTQGINYTLKLSKLTYPKVKSTNPDQIFCIVEGGKAYLNGDKLPKFIDPVNFNYIKKYNSYKGIFIDFNIAGKYLIARFNFSDKGTQVVGGMFGASGAIFAATQTDDTYLIYLPEMGYIHIFDDKKEFETYFSKLNPEKFQNIYLKKLGQNQKCLNMMFRLMNIFLLNQMQLNFC